MGRTIGFYQNFALDLQLLSRGLRCVRQRRPSSYDELGQCMGINSPKAEGYLGWLRHTGLVRCPPSERARGDATPYELTEFGQLVAEYDLLLTDPGTQWLLHYHLGTEHEERSDAWRVLVGEFMYPGKVFSATEFGTYFASVVGRSVTNRSALAKDPAEAIKTYERENLRGLGQLGLLIADAEGYRVSRPVSPPLLVLAYMLFDWWDRYYPHSNVLRLSQLYQEQDSPGRVCLADEPQMEQAVRELAGLGYLVFRATQHEQVTRLYADPPIRLLDQYYSNL